jgi:trypsin
MILKNILNLLIVSSIFLFCQAEDLENDKTPKIVGGEPAYIEEVPYQVSLRRLFQNDTVSTFVHTCGGIIISPVTILTAAHCIFGRENFKFQIRAGSDLKSQGGQIINVTKMFLYEDYQQSGFYNDIAILKLQSRLQINSKVQPIQVAPRGFKVPDNAPLLVSGWGTTTWQGSSPERLQKVVVPAVSNVECAKAYSNVRAHKICAGIEGRDSCQGDSGGPLVYRKVLVGIVSSGFRCAVAGYPGLYTRVSEFIDWIGLHMFKN